MNPKTTYRNKRFLIAMFCLMMVALCGYPTQNVVARDKPNDSVPSPSTPVAIDDATHPLESSPEPFVEKSGAQIIDLDDVKEVKQFEYSIFLPSASTAIDAHVAAADASWQTIHRQTFEASFPPSNSLWTIYDANGSSVGVAVNPSATLVWDDTATRAFQGYWSAHPNDWNRYANLTDTWMRYGPFSLVGATNARYSFKYWLDTEAYYDFFWWEYSCDGTSQHYSGGESRSGPLKIWRTGSGSMLSCIGKDKVYLKFRFISDYSNPVNPAPTGVWVDDILIEKYQ